MSQFRSEEMNLVQLFVQSDAAHETLHELGQIGAIQFKDVSQTLPESNRTYLDLEAHALILKLSLCWQLNKDKTAFQRIFVQDVRKCEDMLRIIRYLKGLHAKVCGCRSSRCSAVLLLSKAHRGVARAWCVGALLLSLLFVCGGTLCATQALTG